jgi:hypothetical protein
MTGERWEAFPPFADDKISSQLFFCSVHSTSTSTAVDY